MVRSAASLLVLLVGASLGCHEHLVLELPLPEVESARSLIFFYEPQGAQARVVVVDLQTGLGRESLPTAQAPEPRIELTALYFDEPLETLGLEPGSLQTSTLLSSVFSLGYRATLLEENAPSGARVTWQVPWELIQSDEQLSSAVKETLYPSCRFIDTVEGRVCIPNLVCSGGACERDFCWGEPRKVRGLDSAETTDLMATPVVEGGATWLYFVTNRYYEGPERCEDGTVPCNHHAKVRLGSPDQAELSTLERLPTGDFDGKGWSGTPHVANGGLEMFFESSRPDAEWWEGETYLATRASREAPWGTPVLAVDVPPSPPFSSSVHRPVLLPDRKSLALIQDNIRWAVIYRRQTTTPGDAAFEYLGRILTFEGNGDEWELWPMSVSSDGKHLFYIRRLRRLGDQAPHEARVAQMADLTEDLITFQQPRALALPQGTHADRRGLLSVAEHPNGRHLYFSDFEDTWVADAVPCE